MKNSGPLAPLTMPVNNDHPMWSTHKDPQGVWAKPEQPMWSTQDSNSGIMPRRSDNVMTGILR